MKIKLYNNTTNNILFENFKDTFFFETISFFEYELFVFLFLSIWWCWMTCSVCDVLDRFYDDHESVCKVKMK